ncbi:GNAT family N-acetyltransferase [Nocardioides anomalus]|uniref:GNAT family N-acetyltransferase n=2 Tax=Nocardioides anomalus TaxID=2712223 RepID=A0A6G6WBS5_9ACTN|nr:GNAT family N-acetyltransferase [Nocardioides anomalus]
MMGTVGSVTVADTVELWPVYDAVFGDHASYDEWRAEVWDRHVEREGFRLARARRDGELVGFAYGYTGQRGQWWTDHVAAVLEPAVAEEWLGGHFELVSIGVLPSARGAGVGGRLLEAVCAGLAQERWLLTTTADAADPARRMYAAHGWSVLGPGIGPGTVVLGRLNPAAGGP